LSEYQETIKNLDKVRGYMRDLYIYGFRTRRDFSAKSARTYDNERRRIESWLNNYIQWDYSVKGKSVCISVDSSKIEHNPLFVAWKSKSFTDNDITLHFLLLDILSGSEELSAPELTERLSSDYSLDFELQTVRGKLREYEREGILTSRKDGRTLLYSLSEHYFDRLPHFERLCDAAAFFSEISVGGYLGSTLLDGLEKYEMIFRFKHHFIAHTLDDGIVLDLLSAMQNRQLCHFEGSSRRTGSTFSMTCVPMQILTSVQTGRRYITVYNRYNRRLSNLRIDSIHSIEPKGEFSGYEDCAQNTIENTPKSWGVSFDGISRTEQLFVKLYINEKTEQYIISRIRREGRSGELLRIDKNIYLYSVEVFDSNEIMPWIKTFVGRIISLDGTNKEVVRRFYRDIETMYKMYQTPQEVD